MTYRVIYAGTPEFAVPALAALYENTEVEVVGVYTQPDRPAGRGRKLTASPVKEYALAHGLEVYQPLNLKSDEDQQQIAELEADLMVVAAYGLILPKSVLDMPKRGCINIHASLLPRWRGAAPIQRAVIEGDDKSGVTIMQMDVGLDTGDMLYKLECEITPSTTSASLHDELKELGGKALMQILPDVLQGKIHPQKQSEELVTYAQKLQKAEAEIDWTLDSKTIARKVNGYNPWPVAFSSLNGMTVRIWQAQPDYQSADKFAPGEIISQDKQGLYIACGSGSLKVTEIQLPNKRRMSIVDAANGFSFDKLVFGQ